ncbi:hypothetical protein CDAR_592791 [Caerostris darwini]|uniref:C2H2-type domain-containing protein n=1 Tax=Caerostris darwini TaxID=1538125 RepID=A0AAV4RXV7_9ARAC|nr:hypothetical protein CDAR_592791 [Caerostris darwini]
MPPYPNYIYFQCITCSAKFFWHPNLKYHLFQHEDCATNLINQKFPPFENRKQNEELINNFIALKCQRDFRDEALYKELNYYSSQRDESDSEPSRNTFTPKRPNSKNETELTSKALNGTKFNDKDKKESEEMVQQKRKRTRRKKVCKFCDGCGY